MLVIKRKALESILIGDNVEIIISEISQDKVKLCINAPKEVKIYRKELVETCEFNEIAANAFDENKLRNLNQMFKKDNEHKI